MKKFVTHSQTKGVFLFSQKAAIQHYRNSFSKVVQTSTLGHRTFDKFVAFAAAEITRSYLLNLLKKPRETPYFIFQVRNVEIGKYIASSVLRDVKTNKGRFRFALKYHIALVRSFFVFGAALRLEHSTAALSLGDAFYLDGIVIDFFLSKPGVVVYLSIHPYGHICVKGTFSNLSSLRSKLDSDRRKHKTASPAQIDSYMKNRLENPTKIIFYYTASKGEYAVPKEQRKAPRNAIIYAHSFTDSQMEYGFDGFKSVYDWLLFTVESLRSQSLKTNIFLKAHPSFFGETGSRDAVVLDREIWTHLRRRIPEYIHVINSEATNQHVLKQFDPQNTILISHHGNAIVEGAYLGFKSVSSASSPWGHNYGFSKTWNSRREYGEILEKLEWGGQLDDEGDREARKFISDVYLNEVSSVSSDSYFLNVIARNCKITVTELRKSPFDLPSFDTLSEEKAIRELADNIRLLPLK